MKVSDLKPTPFPLSLSEAPPELVAMILLVRREQPESEEALRLARSLGVDVKVVYADDPRVAPYLVQSVGTAVTPALVTGRTILPGLDLVKSYLVHASKA